MPLPGKYLDVWCSKSTLFAFKKCKKVSGCMLLYSPSKVCQIMVVCRILHNLMLKTDPQNGMYTCVALLDLHHPTQQLCKNTHGSPAHHMDSHTTQTVALHLGLQFLSSIALMTHTHTAECTDYTHATDCNYTCYLSHGLPPTHCRVLFYRLSLI